VLKTNIGAAMRKDWDSRARSDAFHYIASWRGNWDKSSFFESGEQDYLQLVGPFLAVNHWEPQGKTMLELGCGAGRLTRSFAQRFAKVVAVDVSPEMLSRAQSYLPDAANIVWFQGDGTDLAGVETDSMDFVFCYIVLHHMPQEAVAFAYVREMLRVVKSGGLFLFQFSSLQAPTMNLKGRAAWGLVDIPWMFGFRRVSRAIAACLGLNPELAGRSWRGTVIETSRMVEVVRKAEGVVREVKGQETAMTWVGGVKS
jgi:SAM-dependent methyltransferase